MAHDYAVGSTADIAPGVLAGLGGFDIGDVKMSARSSPSTGWLLCDGSAISRTTYAALFAAIGTTYGVGDGSTTFNVPDLRGRAPFGADPGAVHSGNPLGDQGGTYLPSYSGTTSANSNAGNSYGTSGVSLNDIGNAQAWTSGSIIQAQQAIHQHTLTEPSHTHTFSGSVSLNLPHSTVNFFMRYQ